jgi:hypothetical protein
LIALNLIKTEWAGYIGVSQMQLDRHLLVDLLDGLLGDLPPDAGVPGRPIDGPHTLGRTTALLSGVLVKPRVAVDDHTESDKGDDRPDDQVNTSDDR